MEIVYLLVWIALGFVSAKIAEKKNRDTTIWFIFGVIGGLITVLIISALPPI